MSESKSPYEGLTGVEVARLPLFGVTACCYGDRMEKLPKLSAAEMERMTPDERARAVRERQLQSLDQLDPAFRDRVEKTGRKLLEQRGLLDVEQA